jgi:hypothetical protein
MPRTFLGFVTQLCLGNRITGKKLDWNDKMSEETPTQLSGGGDNTTSPSLQEERQQILKLTLPKAYHALGKDCVENKRNLGSVPQLIAALKTVLAELRSIRETDAETPEAGKPANQAALATASVKRNMLIVKIGQEIFRSHGDDSGPPELVNTIRNLISRLDAIDNFEAQRDLAGNAKINNESNPDIDSPTCPNRSNQLSQSTQPTIDHNSSSTSSASTVSLSKSADEFNQPLPPMTKAENSFDYPRIREDLHVLQEDIADWFKDKDYRVEKTISAKQFGLTAQLANSQPVKHFVIHIVRKDSCYSVTLGYGTDHLKNQSLLGFFGRIVGLNPSNETEIEFWSWINERSAKCCPECQKKDARQGPADKDLGASIASQDIHGEHYDITTSSLQSMYSCKWCSHEWPYGKIVQQQFASITCPSCNEVENHNVSELALDKMLICGKCRKRFLTRPQMSNQNRIDACPSCRILATEEPIEVETGRITYDRDIHGEGYHLTQICMQPKYTCSTCSSNWFIEPQKVTDFASLLCPGCNNTGEYQTTYLELDQSLNCVNCQKTFWTQAQLKHQSLFDICPKCQSKTLSKPINTELNFEITERYIHDEQHRIKEKTTQYKNACSSCLNEWFFGETKCNEVVLIVCPGCGNEGEYTLDRLDPGKRLHCKQCLMTHWTNSQLTHQKLINICPKCQHETLSEPSIIEHRHKSEKREIYGEDLEVAIVTTQPRHNCTFCANEWFIEEPKIFEVFNLECPGCGNCRDYRQESLGLEGFLKCDKCEMRFRTQSQLRHQKLTEICTKCQKLHSLDPVIIELSREVTQRDVVGKEYEVTSVVTQYRNTCLSCSNEWFIDKPLIEEFVFISCPRCKKPSKQVLDNLSPEKSLKCENCSLVFLTEAQLEYSEKQAEAKELKKRLREESARKREQEERERQKKMKQDEKERKDELDKKSKSFWNNWFSGTTVCPSCKRKLGKIISSRVTNQHQIWETHYDHNTRQRKPTPVNVTEQECVLACEYCHHRWEEVSVSKSFA